MSYMWFVWEKTNQRIPRKTEIAHPKDDSSASLLEYKEYEGSWRSHLKLDTISYTLTQQWNSLLGIPNGGVQYFGDGEKLR